MAMAGQRSIRIRGRGGFTLLELMVVISIIAMLTSILMPSLKRAKEQARQVVCQSNLRQFSYAWQMYSTDNSDFLCSSNTFWNEREYPWNGTSEPGNMFNNWISDGPRFGYNQFCNTNVALEKGVLWGYTETAELYKCESDRRGLVRSYAMAHSMGCPLQSAGESNFYSITNIISPSERLVFVDARAGSHRQADGSVQNVGCFDPINTFTNEWAAGAHMITARHWGECDMVKGDLSVERFKWRDQRTIDFANGEISFPLLYESSNDNEDVMRLRKLMKGRSYRTQ